MTALDATYYDAEASPLDYASLTTHALMPVWEAVADLVEDCPVYDLGCGVGGLPLTLWGVDHAKPYVGIDFSERSLELAAAALANAAGSAEGYSFRIGDLRQDPPYADDPLEGDATFVLTEVLEHLDDDLGVLRRWVPPGKRLVFSVPNHPSVSHVRHFNHPGDAFMRYGSLVRFTQWRLFDLSPPQGRAVHLFEGVVREDLLC